MIATRARPRWARVARDVPRFFGASTYVDGKCATLAFYETHHLLELNFEREMGVARAFVLHGPTRTFWLNGESQPIHEVNELEDLELTDATVADYLRFFVCFLRADLGGFVLIESPDEVASGGNDGFSGNELRELAETCSGNTHR